MISILDADADDVSDLSIVLGIVGILAGFVCSLTFLIQFIGNTIKRRRRGSAGR